MSTPHNPSLLDPGQIIKASYDDATQRLRVDANITAPDGQAVIIDDADDSIKIGDGNGTYATITETDGKNAIDVNIAGGTITVTSVKIEDSSGNPLNSTAGALNVQVQNFPATQAVTQNTSPWVISASSLPLPTGAATAALQTQPGVDIGDVTINNASGVSAVNIQDGGNSITVDGTVSAAQSGTWNINNISGTISLPTGAATESTLSSLNSKVIAVNTGAVVVSSSALPTGAATSALQTTGNTSLSSIDSKVPANLTVTSTRLLVDNSGVTQPVSGTVTVTQATGTNLHTVIDSGTVTANIGTTNGLALDATLTGGSQKTKIVDSGGTNVATVSAAGAVKVDGSAVTQPVSGTITANAGTGTFTISGTVTANAGTNLNTSLLALESGGNLSSIKTDVDNLNLSQGSTTSGQKGNLTLGATTTAAPTYTTAQSNPLSLTTAGALRTDASATTQPVSGTIAATQSGTWSVRNQDGSGNSLSSTTNALDINIKSGSIPAGSALIGKVGIDQTTPGTTNKVFIGTNGQISGVTDPNNSFGNQPSGDLGPILIAGSTGTAAGTYAKIPASIESVGTDASGNTIWGLAVKDFSQGVSNTFGGPSATPPEGIFTNGSGNQDWGSPTGQAIFIDISGTWTGSLTLKQQLLISSPVVNFRSIGTGTLSSSITTNGLYVVEGELTTDLTFINGVSTGELDVYAISVAGYSSGFYSHQAGTWNINNISGTITLPTLASTSTLQTTGNSSLSSIDGKLASLGQKAMVGSEPVVIASDQSAIPVSQNGTWNINNISGTISLPSLAATSTKQSDGSQKTQIVDGSGNVIASTSNALNVNFTNTSLTTNQGTANTISNAWPIKITDGTDTAQINSSGGLLSQLIDSNGNNITSTQYDRLTSLNVEDINGDINLSILKQILWELRSTRMAMTFIACDGNRANPNDFNPEYQDFGYLSDTLR